MSGPYRSITSQSLHYYARPHERVPDRPLSGAVAWYGGDLQEHDDWRYCLTAAEIEEIERALVHARATGKPREQLSAADFPLPTLAARIADWRVTLQRGRGFVVIRGLPVTDWSEADSELFFWCLGWHLGLPGAQNRFGELLGHVRDTGVDPDDPTVREYRTRLPISFHCDAADVVGLLCLKTAASGGASRIASSVTLFNELLSKGADVARLFRPFLLDARAEAGLQTFPIEPCRYHRGVLRTFYHSGYFRSATRYDGVEPLTADELALLDAYDALADDPDIHLAMELEPGDIQLCSNHSIVHSRAGYTDHEAPDERRHLLRLWLSLPESIPYRVAKMPVTAGLAGRLLRCRWQQRGRIVNPL
ncbi:hypothetical protein FHR99_001802 [Litorivivens lipolytica]|uniref:TauD/TfdA-like domain-containing protein n=1 Tax=Litorivivens lipolytica TaxID=1524264 RepID=A0A7W4Z743_9GAMM|nr:TauD/TfdA family dioxygenase [Litorivivens lipolytica]MBB3047536.1 hypothetical protein [Litorivivens lipolytica]